MNLVVYEGFELTDEDLRVRLEAALKPARFEARRRSTGRNEDVLSELSKIQAKTLIVWGRDDRAVPLVSACDSCGAFKTRDSTNLAGAATGRSMSTQPSSTVWSRTSWTIN